MAASQEQKVDFLLKKIGYTASKTGIAEDETGISGTKKAPFAEPIPSPLTLPGANVWSQSNQIPTTPPGATTSIVRVYKTGTAQQLTFDSTVAGNRSFVSRETPGEVTSTVVGDWVDTQFGSDYIVKVYKGDPNSGGVQLSAAGSGSNDTWFFDYSAGVLNFNGTNVPSGITTTNIYLEGYRYTGIKGVTGVAQTFTDLEISGITTFNGAVDMNSTLDVDGDTQLDDLNVAGVTTFLKLVDVNNRLDVVGGANLDQLNLTGVSTFASAVDINAGLDVDGQADLDEVVVAGVSTFSSLVDVNNRLDVVGGANIDQLNVSGVSTFAGITTVTGETLFTKQLNVAGVSTFKDNSIIEGSLTVGNDVSITGGAPTDQGNLAVYGNGRNSLIIQAGNNNEDRGMAFRNSGDFYIAYISAINMGSNNADLSFGSGTGQSSVGSVTERIRIKHDTGNVGIGSAIPTAKLDVNGSLNVAGVATFSSNIDANGTLDVDGQADLDEVVVAGVSTFNNTVDINSTLDVDGDTQLDDLNVAGVATFSSNIDANGTLDVDGDTQVDDLNVAGVATFSSLVDANNRLDVVGGANIDQLNIAGVSTFAGITTVTGETLFTKQLNVSGVSTFNSNLNVDDINIGQWTGDADYAGVFHKTQTGNEYMLLSQGDHTFLSANSGYDVVIRGGNNTNTNNIRVTPDSDGIQISGNTTFYNDINVTGNIDANGNLDVDGDTQLDDLNVAGVSTFSALVDIDAGAQANSFKVEDLTNNRLVIAGTGGELEDSSKVTFDGSTLAVLGDATFSGNVTIGGTLIKEDITNIDSIGIVTAGRGVRVTAGGLVVNSGLGTFSDSAYFPDNSKIKFGDATTPDLEIYHSGAQSIISDQGEGGLTLLTSNLRVRNAGDSKFIIQAGVEFANLYHDGNERLATTREGVLVSGGTTTGTLSVTGVSTFTGAIDANGDLDVDGQTDLDVLNVSDTATFSALVDVNNRLDVVGGANIDQLNVTGVSTFSGAIDANGTLDVDGDTQLDDLNVAGVATFSSNINANGNIIGDNSTNISGINSVTATSFFGNGANLSGVGTQTNLGAFDNLVVAGIATFHSNIDANGTLDVDGHTELDNLKVVGVATFTGGGANFENGINTFDVRYITNTNTKITFGTDIISLHGNVGINSTAPTSKLDVVGDTQLDDLNVAGVSTFTSNSIFLSKVGIGTTNPIAELDVNVGSSVTAFNVAGSEGQLFSVTNNLTSGSIFEVNDVSGMPSIDVDADGTIQLAPHGAGELVGIGTTVPTSKLHVVGDTLVTGVSTFTGAIDANGNLDVDGDTQLDDLNVSGVSTFTALVDVNNRLDVVGGANIDQLNITGISTFKDDVEFHGASGIASITFDKSANELNFKDDVKLTFGDAGTTDSEIHFDGANLNIKETSGGGSLRLDGHNIFLRNPTQSDEIYLKCNGQSADRNVELYHQGEQRLETTKEGIIVSGGTTTGTLSVTGVSTFVGDAQFDDKVGIGNTVPNATLEVNGPIKTNAGSYTSPHSSGESLSDAALVIPSGSGIYVEHDQDGVGRYTRNLIKQSSNIIEIGRAGTGFITEVKVLPGTSGFFSVYNNASEVFRVHNDGNVGIGTVDPETNLTIAKNATGQTVATIPTVRLTNLDTTAVATDIVGSYEFFSKDVHSLNKVTGFMRNTPTDAGVNYDLTFGTIKTGDSNAVERLRITSDGNVGIGSAIPTAKLDVNGTISSGDITISDTNPTLTFTEDDGNPDYRIIQNVGKLAIQDIQDSFAERFAIDSAGRIVINRDLDVGRNLKVTGVSTFTGNIDANGNLDVDGQTDLDDLAVAGVSTFTGNINANGNIVGDNSTAITGIANVTGQNANSLNLLNVGYIGNTTTIPSTSFLHFNDQNVPAFGSGGNFTTLGAVSGLNLVFDTNNNDNNGLVIGSGSTNTSLMTTHMVVSHVGNVGIGTDDPKTALHVKNGGGSGYTGSYNARTSAIIEGDNASGTVLSIMGKSSGYSGLFFGDESQEYPGQVQYVHSNDSLRILTGVSERVRINSTGVGIGTDDPQAPLHIEDGSPGIRLSDSGNAGAFAYFDANAANVNIHADKGNNVADSRVSFAVDNNEKVRITSDGNLGINNTSPTSKLDVVGDAKISGVVTATDFDATSDIRLKTNVQPIEDPIAKVIQIEGVSFNWKKDDRPALGVIADQVEKILPQLVHGDDPKTVNYNGLVGLLIEVVKDQQKQIDTLSERISKLE